MLCIRPATKQDSEAVWRIFHAVVEPGDTYTFDPHITKADALAYWMGSDKHVYVAEDEHKEVVGTYVLKDNQPALGAHIANASYMVWPGAQGRSIGRRMAEHSLQRAKDLGYKAIQFNIVVSTNTVAIALWKKMGFSIIGTLPEAFAHQKLGKLVDAYIMFRKL